VLSGAVAPTTPSGGDDALRAKAREAYGDTFARTMEGGMADYETSIRAVKDSLFARLDARGVRDVVEIGVGTGPNMRYYGGMRVTGVEPNAASHAYAAANAAKHGLERFDVIEGVAENLPMPDASADAVVGTLVNCSVASVARAAAEAKRVLRPGGVYLFLDHVAAPSGTPLLALQKTLEPLNRIAYEGCRLTRDPVADIEAAGFGGGVRAERFLAGSGAIETSWLMQPDAGEAARRIAAPGGVMEGIEPHFLLAPHVAGVATK
jgi:SAM-dependent methyltransferase